MTGSLFSALLGAVTVARATALLVQSHISSRAVGAASFEPSISMLQKKPVVSLSFAAEVQSSSSPGETLEVIADHHRLVMSVQSAASNQTRDVDSMKSKDSTILDFLNNRQYSHQHFFGEAVCYMLDLNTKVSFANQTEGLRRTVAKPAYQSTVGELLGVQFELYDVAAEYGGPREVTGGRCDMWLAQQSVELSLAGFDANMEGLMAKMGIGKLEAVQVQAAMKEASNQRDAADVATALLSTNASFCITLLGEMLETNVSSFLTLHNANASVAPLLLWQNTMHTSATFKHGHATAGSLLDASKGPTSGHCVDLTQGSTGSSELQAQINDASRISRINAEATGHWQADAYDIWQGLKIEEIVPTLGTELKPLRLPLRTSMDSHFLKMHGARFGRAASSPLPSSFDPRSAWPMCASIGLARNQGGCGSCWAFSATSVLADRFCIAETQIGAALLRSQTNHSSFFDLAFSPGHLVDCDVSNNGCQGGRLDDAWWFLRDTGVPLETCRPYRFCPGPNDQNCKIGSASRIAAPIKPEEVQQCGGTCGGETPMQLFHASRAYAVSPPGDVQGLQRELFMHGPVQVAFYVFSDFHNYKFGVYFRTPGAYGPLGGHAVKLLGWGVSSMDYWLLTNSWSPHWGVGGSFKMRRGTNECGIESTPAAGLPKFDEDVFKHIYAAI